MCRAADIDTKRLQPRAPDVAHYSGMLKDLGAPSENAPAIRAYSPQSRHPPQDLSAALGQSQIGIEEEKTELARTLHDDLGGLLVGAIMDIGWVSQQSGHTPGVSEKLARATGLLRSAIGLERILIENLRPTLLENVGLFATLGWHMKETCAAAGVSRRENYPDAEVDLAAETKIGVFRIFQEALKRFLADGSVREISVDVEVVNDHLNCHLSSTRGVSHETAAATESTETTMNHRALRMGGSVRVLKSSAGNHMHLSVPLSHAA
ncbi:MAG: hypothetical protein NVS1B6_13980 [Steroidobacteraceae bacterium]